MQNTIFQRNYCNYHIFYSFISYVFPCSSRRTLDSYRLTVIPNCFNCKQVLWLNMFGYFGFNLIGKVYGTNCLFKLKLLLWCFSFIFLKYKYICTCFGINYKKWLWCSDGAFQIDTLRGEGKVREDAKPMGELLPNEWLRFITPWLLLQWHGHFGLSSLSPSIINTSSSHLCLM